MSSTTPLPNLTTSTMIDLVEAQESIRRYIAHVASETDPTYAFKVGHHDILAALGIKLPAEGKGLGMVRVYFGLATEDLNFKMRLFLVPLDSEDRDILPEHDGKLKVYDFNLPCPTTCDVNSPLYYGNLRS